MTRRSGVTLTEVLVAIFISGIGLMTLMIMFPLAGFNMQQAIKDQRTADADYNAASIDIIFGLHKNAGVVALYGAGTPSNVVYIDPIGSAAGSPNISGTAIQRWNAAGTTPGATPSRWMTLLDEMKYDDSGSPVLTAGGPVQREPRYSWAYMVQQTQPSGPWNLTVVVYDRRAPIPGTTSGWLQEETPCTATFNAGSNVVTLTGAGGPPVVKRGSWILDATPTNGYFYRVASVSQPSGNTVTVVLCTNAIAGSASTTAVIMDSVAEVFNKGLMQ